MFILMCVHTRERGSSPGFDVVDLCVCAHVACHGSLKYLYGE